MFSLILLCACFLSINAQFSEIRLLPDVLSFTNVVIHLPVFVLMLIFMGLGLLLGTILEYLRAYKDRKVTQKKLLYAERLNAESKQLRNSMTSETDEILSLLK